MMEKVSEFIGTIGGGINFFVSVITKAASDALKMTALKYLPFLCFIALITGIITATGLGDLLANVLVPLASSLVGLIVLAFICTIPILSPILAPGAAIAAVIGTLIGTQIGNGALAPQYALPALYAIDSQVGCDTLPLSMGMMDASEEVMAVDISAVLISRWITGIISVVIAWAFSFGMY